MRLLVGAAVLVATDLAMVFSMARHVQWGWHILIACVVFVAVAWWLRRDLPRASFRFIVIITAVVQLIGLLVFPLTSDDVYRYVWDGRVQLAGISPYRFPPMDEALAFLRDPMLFPPGDKIMINRPGVPTIYPPGAQLWFTMIASVVPWSLGTLGVRIGAGVAVVVTTALLARFLGDRRRWALVYGASPLVLLEGANGGHLDALCALAVFGLGWAAVRRRHWLAGLFLGVAASLKLVPLLLIPAFLASRRWRTSLTGVGVAAAGYVPHVLVVGTLVVGFLPGYVAEEGYDGARRFALLIWLPEAVRLPVALALGVALAVLALWRSRSEPILETCCWLYGGCILLATPVYPWYALPFIVLVIMAGRLEWLALWAAMYVAFVFDDLIVVQGAAYGAALITVLVVGWRRRRRRVPSLDAEPTAVPVPAADRSRSGEPVPKTATGFLPRRGA